jgi:hypothetical protein
VQIEATSAVRLVLALFRAFSILTIVPRRILPGSNRRPFGAGGPTRHKVRTKLQLTISLRKAGMPGTAVPIKVRPTLTKALRCIRRRSLAMR